MKKGANGPFPLRDWQIRSVPSPSITLEDPEKFEYLLELIKGQTATTFICGRTDEGDDVHGGTQILFGSIHSRKVPIRELVLT